MGRLDPKVLGLVLGFSAITALGCAVDSSGNDAGPDSDTRLHFLFDEGSGTVVTDEGNVSGLLIDGTTFVAR